MQRVMIILKHLTVERFRLLRELNLHFPQRGSILIQGSNESGKSALLESIYFALYGEALASHRKTRALDDLILYGATNATVTLTLSIGTTELTITRTLERGGQQGVSLSIHKLGVPAEEPITQIECANVRIISEMGDMDGQTLRDSCLIEQKGLGRLESISGSERETTTRKLLGLEKLTRVLDRFQVSTDDEQTFTDATQRLHLAEIQAHIPELSKQLEDIEIALDAVRVHQKLAEIKQQEGDIEEQEQAFEEIETKRVGLKQSQGRAQQLRRADGVVAELITAYDEMAEARLRLPELEKQIAELERREREELPLLEQRVNELSDLTHSFGTLQRMSNDVLTAVDSMKDLQEESEQHSKIQQDLKDLQEQVMHVGMDLNQIMLARQDAEEQQRDGRPRLEARLARLKNLSERLNTLRAVEEQYTHRLTSRDHVEDNREKLSQVQKALPAAEQALAQLEPQAAQSQQQADSLEQRHRQLRVRGPLETWYRLTQAAEQTNQQVNQARQQQSRFNLTMMDAQRYTHNRLLLVFGSGLLFVIFLILTILIFTVFSQIGLIGILTGIIALVALGGTVLGYQKFTKARAEEQVADKRLQEVTSHVSRMIVEREATAHMSGNNEKLSQAEQEIRALGVNVPASLDEAQRLLAQAASQQEDLAALHQQATAKRHEADAASNQAKAAAEHVAGLRQEHTCLKDLRQQEDWDHIDEHLDADQASIAGMQQEITVLARQENLPFASISARLRNSGSLELATTDQLRTAESDEDEDIAGIPDLEALVESTMGAIEGEMASLDGIADQIRELSNQIKVQQEALDGLLARQSVSEARNAHYQTNNPALQLEQAREQQTGLRQALQSLRHSLRQRVTALGVDFQQNAVSNAEVAARTQLENLHITLGNKIVLQEDSATATHRLKEHHASLPGLYKQLGKFSNTLGSWIVPPNPFTEALIGLRTRCQHELDEINEPTILKDLDTLQSQEGASKAKIKLCQQEIETAQEGIAALLVQHNRPQAKGYTSGALTSVWPLLNEYTVEDSQRLAEEFASLEKALTSLEQQEVALSTRLGTGHTPLDLAQARSRMEQQEHSYLSKKYAKRLVEAVDKRLMQKMLPRTAYYMQRILPLLTSGRYHDVHLTTEAEEGSINGSQFQLLVWDSAAGEYVPKSALSGGAADQLSLALRLAFAIATLPRELHMAPSFVVLDEPLSSFDHGRAQALVDVVTGDILSQHFEQVVLISHSSAFDPAMFPYHMYMDNGVVVESNLPVVPEVAPVASNDEDEMVTMQVPAVSVNARATSKQ